MVLKAWGALGGMEFQSPMAEGKKACLWASVLEGGTESFICRPQVDLWCEGPAVLQVGETSTRSPIILYIMVALVTVRRVFSVSNFSLTTSTEALVVAL